VARHVIVEHAAAEQGILKSLDGQPERPQLERETHRVEKVPDHHLVRGRVKGKGLG